MPIAKDINKEEKSPSINFICPICKKSVDEDGKPAKDDNQVLDVILDPETGQAYHLSCVKEKQEEIEFETK